MRFLQGKSVREVGAVMGISDEAAQKRVQRAIEKLRAFFARRGLTMEAGHLARGLTRQAAQLAPAALAPAVAAGALKAAGAAASAGGGVGILAKLIALVSNKVAAATCAAAVVVGGGATVVIVTQSRGAAGERQNAPAVVAAPATAPADGPLTAPAIWQPVTFATAAPLSVVPLRNLVLMPIYGNSPDYDNGIDTQVIRKGEGASGEPAGILRRLSPNAKPQDGARRGMSVPLIQPYRGKRVRLAAWLKSENVDPAAGLGIIVVGTEGRILVNDDMGGRAVIGTTDWKRYEVVADIPPEAQRLDVTALLRGSGTLWIDSMQIEIVGSDVPTTDDSRWHPWSYTPAKYSAQMDNSEMRNGHPTLRMRGTTGRTGDWFAYDHNERQHVEDLLGKRVRLSAMIKCDGVSNPSGPSIRALGPAFATLARDSSFPRRPVKGTMPWMRYSVTLDVPANAQGLCWGFIMNGRGTMWIDEVAFEVLDSKP
jgi:hypothetical protein